MVSHREGEGGPDYRCPDMRTAVPIPPAAVMGVGDRVRRDGRQGTGEIGKDAGFILDGRECGSGPCHEHMGDPFIDPALADDLPHLMSDIENIPFMLGCHLDLFPVHMRDMGSGDPLKCSPIPSLSEPGTLQSRSGLETMKR